MPVQTTYPGVYIEEVPSGVRTITGVATSVTAFLGRTLRGQTNEPVIINSFADFERQFGGLWIDGPLSYAVRDFYLNGGSQAIIVRLFNPAEGTTGLAILTVDNLKLEASNPGEWGNTLRVKIDYTGITDEIAQNYNSSFTADDLFNLTVVIVNPVKPTEILQVETFRNLTVMNSSRRVDRVLLEESRLVRLQKKNDGTPDLPDPAVPPAETEEEADPTNPEADQDEVLKFAGGANSEDLDENVYQGSQSNKTGIFALEKTDIFNLLCIPPDIRHEDIPPVVFQTAMAYCEKRRAMLIVDSPVGWSANKETAANEAKNKLSELNLSGTPARNAAIYFPHIIQSDPLSGGQLDSFVPCGIVAGIFARTDVQRGVWKAPAGLDAALNGIQGLNVNLTDAENGMLNPIGINCLRSFPINGRVIWGARTLRGADQLADEYKYIPVRRLALYLEESLYRGTQWVVFEPNDEPLWAQIRLNVGAFMQNLFRQGAFQGQTPRDAYLVKCDSETTTQDDINRGVVNVLVGFAPLKPAEFVIIKIQQLAGQIQN
jgi:uncharacterized protein